MGKTHTNMPTRKPILFLELLRSQTELAQKSIPQVIFVCTKS